MQYDFIKPKRINPRIECTDGTTLSVQASKYCYCHPRSDDGPYTHVEVGYISDPESQILTPPDSWREYADGEFPSNVYGFVPIQMVADLIDKHGGPVE